MYSGLEKANEIAVIVEREMESVLESKRQAFIATLSPAQVKDFRELEDLMIEEAGKIQGEMAMAFPITVH